MAEKRLINAWDMIEWLDNIDKANQLRLLRGKKAKFLDTNGVRHMVNTMPTVDAAEVVHGRWDWPTKIKGSSWDVPHCSLCNKGSLFETNYCSNCGAKMDGGTDNGEE